MCRCVQESRAEESYESQGLGKCCTRPLGMPQEILRFYMIVFWGLLRLSTHFLKMISQIKKRAFKKNVVSCGVALCKLGPLSCHVCRHNITSLMN